MKKFLLAVMVGCAFTSTATAFAETKDVKDLYFFQIKAGNKVLTEFEQKVAYKDIDDSDFSYQHKTKYYKDCRSDNNEVLEVTEGAQGLVSYDEELDLEQLHMNFDVNANRKLGLCQPPQMENFEISFGFPFLTMTQEVQGSLGNKYTVNIGKVRIDSKTKKVVYPTFERF